MPMNGVTFCLVGIPPDSAKGRRDGMVATNENRRRPLSSGEVEGLSWQGPRTIFLQKNSQGFGFTLRHFIVYPPDSSLLSIKDEENANTSGKFCQRDRLEPMDTIFVKSVKEHGPAQKAGLCTGDRLVKVNGESILGKTYSQVITLIQNSENILELSIMPKDDDVLQLVSAYSQDAYHKDNEPYTGEAQHLPNPPPFGYPTTKTSPTAPKPSNSCLSPLDNWQCQTSLSTSILDNCPPTASTSISGWSGDPKDSSHYCALSGRYRGRSSSAINALDFHFANHNAAIASATLPPQRKTSLPASRRAHTDALCQQALSDWFYSQAEAVERLSSHNRSISQDHLAELGLGLEPSPASVSVSKTSSEQCKIETILRHQRAATDSLESHWLGDSGDVLRPGSRLCSESLLAAYAEYEHNYGRSVATLAQASALVSTHHDHIRSSQGPQTAKANEQKDHQASGRAQHQITEMPAMMSSSIVSPGSRQSGHQVAEPQTRRAKEEELVGYKSYSPSFSRKVGHFLQQTQSFREPSLNWSPNTRSSPADGEGEMVTQPQPSAAIPTSKEERVKQEKEKEITTPVILHQEIVMRRKPHSGHQPAVQVPRQPHCAKSVESPGHPDWAPSPVMPPSVSEVTSRTNGSFAQHAFDSLSSIPFIGSIKGRRTSYLLAITTERSKSIDEGLNTFREDGRVFSRLPKRVKSFFTDGSLESLRAQEETRSKRHSTSELGNLTFSDVRKEGWLHYKQILTQKGKKVGGGMRLWKRVFCVLRSHSLFLYKDKREAVLHGAGAGPGQDEHPPISICGCLIDIAYSETKRKHTLRLTTQNFCEYLLQAEDRDDMLAWIRVIRENSKTNNEEIGFSKQALINKKLNDYKKQSLTGSKPDSSPRALRMMPPFLLAKTDNTSMNRGSRTDDNKALWGINIMKKTKKTGSPKAFGVRLEDCQPAVNHKFVPLIVEMCCGVVEASGLEYTGIYRVPGNNAMVSNLQEHLNKGMDINTAEERWQDLNVISSLLKSFFRKLPEPLFTDDKYNDFIEANRIENAEDRLKTMKKLIHDLPDHYFHTLKFMARHLRKVADHSEKNKMEPRNLALVFGPTLVRMSEDNMTDMVTHMPDRYKIVETLILHCDWFFCSSEFDKEEKTPEDKRDMQPVPNIDHLLSNIGRPGMPGEASDSTTSDSLKSKIASGLNPRDFLPKSIISAVTRKRKKCPSRNPSDSSTDEDSEHEPVKASNYGIGGGGEGEPHKREDLDLGEKEQKGNDGKDSSAVPEAGKKIRNGRMSEVQNSRRKSGKAGVQPPAEYQVYPNSFHHQIQATPPCLISPPPQLKPHNLSQRRPTIPFWIRPTRPLNNSQASSLQGIQYHDWNQPESVHYRKNRGGRTRAVSVNLDLVLDRSEDRIKSWRGDSVEEVRVIERGPSQLGYVGVPQGPVMDPVSLQQRDPLPHFSRDDPSLSSSSGWTDQCSLTPSTVILRRSALGPRDKTRVLRRHTIVV